MSQRGMAFPASRQERPVPVVENSGGGYDLKRYIVQDTHKVPGYTGHVPGRKIEFSGIGRTYGTATRNLMNPTANPDVTAFTTPRNPIRSPAPSVQKCKTLATNVDHKVKFIYA